MSLVTNRLGFALVGLVVAKDVVAVVVKQERRKRLKRTAMATMILLCSQQSIMNMFSYIDTNILDWETYSHNVYYYLTFFPPLGQFGHIETECVCSGPAAVQISLQRWQRNYYQNSWQSNLHLGSSSPRHALVGKVQVQTWSR